MRVVGECLQNLEQMDLPIWWVVYIITPNTVINLSFQEENDACPGGGGGHSHISAQYRYVPQ